jgi:hypothetical protein
LLAVLALTVLAAGCCCPPLSGRYEQPLIDVKQPASHERRAAGKESGNRRHRRHLVQGIGHRFGWHGLGDGPETPPGQHVPLPKFHPVPVRPVFEPQYDYSPPLADWSTLAPIVTPETLAVPTPSVPPPTQPVPDPE